MAVADVSFNREVILDNDAFNTASKEMNELSVQMQKLKSQIEEMLARLKSGFDTPAGVKFFSSCEKNLLQPFEDQIKVIQHVSSNLARAQSDYQSVFTEYQRLNSIINNN